MKFKYKKIIIIITMFTMCIGMVTLSLMPPTNENKGPKKVEATENPYVFTELNDEASLIEDAGIEEEASEFEANQEEISQLVASYLSSTLTCDLQQLEKIVTDVESIDIEELQAKQRLIAEYKNVESYTIDGLEKGSYLVYVYCELKFTGIETAAPGLNRLYIITDENNQLKIDLSPMSQEMYDFISKADESQEVKKIIDTVNRKLEEAINQDTELREFYSNLNGGSDQVDTEATEEVVEGSEEETETTDTEESTIE
ncbi:MAG: hypothetical protein II992_07415 [Lachnospiraceae bacterium]|nr:hypothetical protein [Lachnospiraceae bacterium]